jgi:hypothetical protein
MSALTALNPAAFSTALFTQQAAASGNTGLFATQLAQILAADAQGQTGSTQTAQTSSLNSTSALATQIAQMQAEAAGSSTTGAQAGSASQTASQSTLQSLDYQAAMALGQGNSTAYATIEAMIAMQQAGGSSQTPAATSSTTGTNSSSSSNSASASQSSSATSGTSSTKLNPLRQTYPGTAQATPVVPDNPGEYVPSGFNA